MWSLKPIYKTLCIHVVKSMEVFWPAWTLPRLLSPFIQQSAGTLSVSVISIERITTLNGPHLITSSWTHLFEWYRHVFIWNWTTCSKSANYSRQNLGNHVVFSWLMVSHGNWRLAPKLFLLVFIRHICRSTKIPTSQIQVYKVVNRKNAIKAYLPYTLSSKLIMQLQELRIRETL